MSVQISAHEYLWWYDSCEQYLMNLKALKTGHFCAYSNEIGVRLFFPLYLRFTLSLARSPDAFIYEDQIIKPHKMGQAPILPR